MKKFMIVVVLVFAFALTMNVAFACDQCRPGMDNCFCPSTSVTNVNFGSAITNGTAKSNTGSNGISKIWGGASIYTGAASAQVVGQSQANWNDVSVTAGSLGKLTVFNANTGTAMTTATANAGTGGNNIGCAGTSGINSGAASSYVNAASVVNYNMVKVNR